MHIKVSKPSLYGTLSACGYLFFWNGTAYAYLNIYITHGLNGKQIINITGRSSCIYSGLLTLKLLV